MGRASHNQDNAMKTSVSLFLILSGLATALPAADAASADDRQPNILLIFADDLGWKDVGYQGTDFYETPNIDRLASQGMVFSAGYSAAGNCQPSRACLISGQYTPRHHVYAVGSTTRGPVSLMRMIPIPNRGGIVPEEISIADALKAAGYATGIFGKWHLSGGGEGAEPAEQGFDVVVDKNHKGSGVHEDPKGIYTLTSAACKFMEEHRERPWFAYVSHHAIHTGLQARQETLDRFVDKPAGQYHSSPIYAGCTYDLDDGVGLLMAKLSELDLEEDTLVVFTSDNGGTPQSPQEPLRGNKGSYFEGGIREPFIVRWPGVTKPGSQCDVPVINVDLFPTFLAASGEAVPEGKVLDGESLLPLLEQKGSLQRQAIFWHFPGYLNGPVIRGRDPVYRTRPVSVINKDHWKLYLYHEEWQLDGGRDQVASNDSVELYNLREDIGERNNLALTNVQKREELLDDLLAWFDRTDALLPTERNPEYDPSKPVSAGKGRGKKRKKQ
jgi:arylsulfatase A-like enzyme